MNTPATRTVVRKVLLLVVFSGLAFFGLCPSWFLGLSIAIGLLRLSGWLFLKIQSDGDGPVMPASGLPRWDWLAQLTWAALLGLQLAGELTLPSMPRLTFTFLETGYLTLACLQTVAFYRIFSRYRPFLMAELTLRNAHVS